MKWSTITKHNDQRNNNDNKKNQLVKYFFALTYADERSWKNIHATLEVLIIIVFPARFVYIFISNNTYTSGKQKIKPHICDND